MMTNVKTLDRNNSKVVFEVKKLGFLTIKSTITDFTGEITFEKDALEQANFNVCVSPSTINTGSSKRDEHLKSKDFFHVNEHPKICFQSTEVTKTGNNYLATGNLSLFGVSKEVSIPFSFTDGVLIGDFSLNRLDYKLGEKFPAFIVGKTIRVSIFCKISN